MDINKIRDDLSHEMKVTKGCRFNAAQRLERRDRLLTRVAAFGSVYVIILTLLPEFFPVSDTLNSVISITTIAMSLIILVSTLIQSSDNYLVRCDRFHRCAIEINKLRRELRATSNIDQASIVMFSKRYDDILDRYTDNHDAVDFERYKIEHPTEYPEFAGSQELDTARKDVRRDRDRLLALLSAMTASAAAATLAAGVPALNHMIEAVKAMLFAPIN